MIPDKKLIENVTRNDLIHAMKCASIQGSRSKAKRLHVGCVILSPKTRGIISSGYNGTAAGEDNRCEDEEGRTCRTVIHAEINAMKKLSWWRRFGSVVVVTHSPCLDCARYLVRWGVAAVVYREAYRFRDGLDYLLSEGVQVFSIKGVEK
jgi:deoxycytidylate deaminase